MFYEVTYVSYVNSKKGIRPDLDEAQAMLVYQEPAGVVEVFIQLNCADLLPLL